MGVLAVWALLLSPTIAAAQDEPVDAGPPSLDASPLALDASASTATDDADAPDEPRDDPDVERLYEAAIDELVAGRFEDAARGFDEVAARSLDEGRRRAALDLAREARDRQSLQRSRGTPVRSDGADPEPWVPPPGGGATLRPDGPQRAAASGESDGRLALLLGTSLYGLAAAGPLTPLSLGVDDTRGFLALYMLVAGGSFFLPFLATRDADVPWGATALGLTASVRGLAHGALFASFASDGDEQALFASMLGASLLELGLGYAWADLTGMTAGQAHAAQLGSDVGLGLGLGLGVIAVGDGFDLEEHNGVAISALLGAAAGVAAGRLFATVRSWTWGDAEVVQTALIVGLYAGAYPMVLFEVDDLRAITSSMLVGGIAGLVFGDRLVSGREINTGQALLIEIGAIAGGLLGAGIGYLAFAGSDGELGADAAKAMLAVSLAASIGGFALTYSVLDIAREGRRAPDEARRDAATLHVAPWLSPSGERGLLLGGTL